MMERVKPTEEAEIISSDDAEKLETIDEIEKFYELSRELPEYSPPYIQEKEFRYSAKIILVLLEGESARLIDCVVDKSRAEETESTKARKANEILREAEESLKVLESKELKAKEPTLEDEGTQNKLLALKVALKSLGPDEETVMKLEERLEATEKEAQVAKEEASRAKKNQEIHDGDWAKSDSRDAKNTTKGIDRLKFIISSNYRIQKTEEAEQGRIAIVRQKVQASEKDLAQTKEAELEVRKDIEKLIAGGLTFEEAMGHARILSETLYSKRDELMKLDDLSDEAFEIAAEIRSLEETILSYGERVQQNHEIVRKEKLLDSRGTYAIQELLRALDVYKTRVSTLEKISQKRRKAIGEKFSNRTYEEVYEASYTSDLDRYKSEELRFVPKSEEVKDVVALVEKGVPVHNGLLEVFMRARERLELLARADDSYVSHATSVNRALKIIESGVIRSADMTAEELGGKPEEYSNSPKGRRSFIKREVYFTLNDYEGAYLGTRFDQKFIREGGIEDSDGSFGAIFVRGFADIGQEVPWYWQQNSQGKSRGAEENVFNLEEGPISIDKMYIIISDDSEVIKFYRDHLKRVGKKEEWIDVHLIPLPISKSGDRKVIADALKERGIVSGDRGRLMAPRSLRNTTSGSFGNSGVGLFKLDTIKG